MFTFDDLNTYNYPSPVTKGGELNLNLVGNFGSHGNITNIHLNIDWNGFLIYDEDQPQITPVADDYKTTIGWIVPSFAPSGEYDVTLVATGEMSGKKDVKIMCIHALMTL